MILFSRLVSVLNWIFRRNRAEARLDDEMRNYIEMSAAEKMRDGVPAAEAERLARIELGGIEQVKESVRSSRRGHLIDETAKDVRYALRMFARTPGFTAVILLTLALGIGANTAIFSLIDTLMLRSLPVKNPNELVLMNLRAKGSIANGETFSYTLARSIDAQRDIFSSAGGFTSMTFDAGAGGAVSRVHGAVVTGTFYQTLGLEPQAGRLLSDEDDKPGASVAIVISDEYWERQYARDVAAIGQAITLGGAPATIVGVSPRGFTGASVGAAADVSIAAAVIPQVKPSLAGIMGPGTFWLRVLARPVRGVTMKDAAARMNARWPAIADAVISPRWTAERRKEMADAVFVLEPGATGWTFLRELYQRPLVVLMAVAGLVLLIACANIASLFLARASTRHREIAVRLALGASRARVVRQLLTEGTLLSFAGAALGVGVAWASGVFLVGLISDGPFQVQVDLAPNSHMLAFSCVLAVITGTVFGLTPAFQTRRTSPQLARGDDSRTSTRRSRMLPALVALQVALSLVLIAGAGLFVRTLWNLRQINPGFSAGGVFIAELESGKGPAPDQLLDAVRRIPGVITASVATQTPLSGSAWSEAIVPAGQKVPDRDNSLIIGAGQQFLETLQIPLIAGRDFTARDMASTAGVAVINERFAESLFPKENPLGRHLVGNLMGKDADLEIVGIAKNTSVMDLRKLPPLIVYVPYPKFGGTQWPNLVIRISGASNGNAEAVRGALQAQMPSSPVELRALSAQMNSTIIQERMMATLAGGFGVLALIISAVGLYGLLAYSVAQRSREIGIRMALGAQSSTVVAGVLRTGAWLVGIGLIIGYPAAWAASRSVESMLFGLKATDPTAMIGAAVLLVAAALVASYVPARRASRVDPLVALRHD